MRAGVLVVPDWRPKMLGIFCWGVGIPAEALGAPGGDGTADPDGSGVGVATWAASLGGRAGVVSIPCEARLWSRRRNRGMLGCGGCRWAMGWWERSSLLDEGGLSVVAPSILPSLPSGLGRSVLGIMC